MANLKQKFNKEMVPVLQEKLGMNNVMAVPRLKKVVINMGVGQALTDKKHLWTQMGWSGLGRPTRTSFAWVTQISWFVC